MTSNLKILVAEKNEDTRALLNARLRVRNYEVTEAVSSLQALQLLDRDRVDVILISDEMERIGTMLPIEVIRRRPHLTSVPVILMTQESRLSELMMTRERGYDDFLTLPVNPFVLHLRILLSVERSRHRAEANALTHLPGNHAIEKVIRKKIEKKEFFSVLYIDINHFKAFNDHYSFEKGDDVIRQTARIMMKTAESICKKGEYFLGHIGGDDFIVVINPDEEERYAKAFISSFDQIIPTYYSDEDRQRGNIRVKNRKGKMDTFPLMSCSVAACTNLTRQYANLGEIARDAMEVKSFLKTQPGSRYLRDRRVVPVQAVADTAPPELVVPEEDQKAEEELMPLGQLLLKAKLISGDQLSLALKKHLQTGQKLGQILTAMKAVQSEEVGKMLERKLKIPYFCLKHFIPNQELMTMLPADFMRLHRVIPLQKMDQQRLKVGLCDPLDRQVLESVKSMTQLKLIPYLVLEEELEELFHRDTQLNLFKERLS